MIEELAANLGRTKTVPSRVAKRPMRSGSWSKAVISDAVSNGLLAIHLARCGLLIGVNRWLYSPLGVAPADAWEHIGMIEKGPGPAVLRRPGGRTAQVSEQVLGAVLEVLAESGPEGLQYDEVARRAGVGRATIYRRWPQREDLVHDALARFGEVSIPVKSTGDIREDLTDFVCSMAATSVTPLGKAMLRVALHRGEAASTRAIGLKLLDERLPALQDRVSAAVADGQMPEVDAGFLNLMLVGPVQLFTIREGRAFTREDGRRIVDVVLAGLVALG